MARTGFPATCTQTQAPSCNLHPSRERWVALYHIADAGHMQGARGAALGQFPAGVSTPPPSADPALRGLGSSFRGDARARSVPGQPWWGLRDRSGPTALRTHTASLQPQSAAQR